SFGVDRRAPRGAFLWPPATVAALGMTAIGSDGQLSMSVAALELLAAQVVAEIGTYTALAEANQAALGLAGAGGESPSAISGRTASPQLAALGMASASPAALESAAASPSSAAPVASAASAAAARRDAG